VEELSAAGKAATEENNQLKVYLGHEMVARSSREERVQLRGS